MSIRVFRRTLTAHPPLRKVVFRVCLRETTSTLTQWFEQEAHTTVRSLETGQDQGPGVSAEGNDTFDVHGRSVRDIKP